MRLSLAVLFFCLTIFSFAAVAALPAGWSSAGRMEDPLPGKSYLAFLENDGIHKVSSKLVRAQDGRDVVADEYEWQSCAMYVLRVKSIGATTRQTGGTAVLHNSFPVTVSFKGAGVWQPVAVDLGNGEIASIPAKNLLWNKGMLALRDFPLSSSPLLIAPTKAIPRRIVWREMSPAEIVDSIYMPWQNPQGTNKGPVKMDVSNEPWARMKTADFLPCFDRYGQFKHRDWPGKTMRDADLKAAAAQETRDLVAHPRPANRDRFGGWAAGPQRKATGRFRTEKVGGKWWLVDPDGRLFWSFGPVRVATGSGMTPLDGNTRTPLCGRNMPDRDCLFDPMPAQGDPLAQFLVVRERNGRGESRFFNFSAANLFRKYGEGWFDAFADRAHRRLKSWGMNTLANGSDIAICLQDRTPYAVRVDLPPAIKVIKGSWGQWNKFRDPFDPSFSTNVREALKGHERAAHDPWCIGFFVENEVQWGKNHKDLARWTLWSPDDQPAKVEFVKRLQAKGIDFDKSNPATVPDSELCAFTDILVKEYFRKIRDEVKAVDSRLLYLGCRFAGLSRPLWALRASAAYCDVLSFNVYRNDLIGWNPGEGIETPVLIGEFHFGAHDRGLFGSGQRNALSQRGRADAIKRYVGSALAHPLVVGVHWHQYADQPTSGRFDGEHFQVGLIDICDRPYPETVDALRAVGYKMYETRSKTGEWEECENVEMGDCENVEM